MAAVTSGLAGGSLSAARVDAVNTIIAIPSAAAVSLFLMPRLPLSRAGHIAARSSSSSSPSTPPAPRSRRNPRRFGLNPLRPGDGLADLGNVGFLKIKRRLKRLSRRHDLLLGPRQCPHRPSRSSQGGESWRRSSPLPDKSRLNYTADRRKQLGEREFREIAFRINSHARLPLLGRLASLLAIPRVVPS